MTKARLVLFPQNARCRPYKVELPEPAGDEAAVRAQVAAAVQVGLRTLGQPARVGFVHGERWAHRVYGEPVAPLDLEAFESDYRARLEARAREAWGTGEGYDWTHRCGEAGQAALPRLAAETVSSMMAAIARDSYIFDGVIRHVAGQHGHTTQRGLQMAALAGLSVLSYRTDSAQLAAARAACPEPVPCPGSAGVPCVACAPHLGWGPNVPFAAASL